MKNGHALVECGLILSLLVVVAIMALGKLSSSISDEADAQTNFQTISQTHSK